MNGWMDGWEKNWVDFCGFCGKIFRKNENRRKKISE